MKVLVCGAGVIGRVYAGRLGDAGHDITVLARGHAVDELRGAGIALQRDGVVTFRPHVVESVPDDEFDVVLVCVRREQVNSVLDTVAAVRSRRVALLCNQPVGLDAVVERLGSSRALAAFPGVGGYREPDGFVRYIQIPAQKTTVGRREGLEKEVVELMRSAALPVDVVDDMDGWLATHAVFIAAVGAAILEHGGDSTALAADRGAVRRMVTAVDEGFAALSRRGVSVGPAPLRTIFARVPTLSPFRTGSGNCGAPSGSSRWPRTCGRPAAPSSQLCARTCGAWSAATAPPRSSCDCWARPERRTRPGPVGAGPCGLFRPQVRVLEGEKAPGVQ